MTSRPGGEQETTDRAGSSRPGPSPRRVSRVALAASVVIHVLAIGLYPLMFERFDPGAATAPSLDTPPPDGLEVIRLIEVEPIPEPDEPDDPDELEEVDEPAADVDAPLLEPLPGIEVVPLGPSLVERLRPRLVDRRLWHAAPPAFYELTMEQREELIVAGRLTDWLDSVAAAQSAEEALTDWTYTDSDGGRWGISPGKLHLGDITLPLPVNFGEPVGKRDENAELVWQWEEIMRQAARAQVEMTWRERAEAIRARRDAERETESRIVAPPDTTRRR